jgi:hypothetical protein
MPPDLDDEGTRAANQLRATALLADGDIGRPYLLQERISQPGQLANAIRTVSAHGSVIDPALVDALVAQGKSNAAIGVA